MEVAVWGGEALIVICMEMRGKYLGIAHQYTFPPFIIFVIDGDMVPINEKFPPHPTQPTLSSPFTFNNTLTLPPNQNHATRIK